MTLKNNAILLIFFVIVLENILHKNGLFSLAGSGFVTIILR